MEFVLPESSESDSLSYSPFQLEVCTLVTGSLASFIAHMFEQPPVAYLAGLFRQLHTSSRFGNMGLDRGVLLTSASRSVVNFCYVRLDPRSVRLSL